MKIEPGLIVPPGYGKYFRPHSIAGLEPLEEGRGPGQRTKVYIERLPTPITASRSEGAILRDLVEMPKEVTRSQEQRALLSDILETIRDINPLIALHYPGLGEMGPGLLGRTDPGGAP